MTSNGAGAIFGDFLEELGEVDLVIISAGAGHNNRDLNPELDADTVAVNVSGFMKTAPVALRHFLRRGRGHLVGLTSMAALRGNGAGAAYAASKAFQSVHLDGLRDLARESGLPITVTEAQPGFVDTAMTKPRTPLPKLARWLLVASPARSAEPFANERSMHTSRGGMQLSLSCSTSWREPVEHGRLAVAAPSVSGAGVPPPQRASVRAGDPGQDAISSKPIQRSHDSAENDPRAGGSQT